MGRRPEVYTPIDEDLVELAISMQKLKPTPLRTLIIGGNECSSSGVARLLEAVIEHSSVESLSIGTSDLSQGEIPTETWTGLLQTLTALDLSYSNLGDTNLRSLTAAFNATNSSLRSLSLAYNDFGDDEFQSFVAALKFEPAILRQVAPQDNVDYNRYVLAHTYQNNALTGLDIRGVNTTVEALQLMCLSFNVFDSLSIDTTTFGAQQLAMSSEVAAVGCPAAL